MRLLLSQEAPLAPVEQHRRKFARCRRWQVMLRSVVEENLVVGQVISGRFRLERLIGHGGMGTVWEARHLALETQVAIKFLNRELSRRHDVLARFSHEATSAARIRSPHVVGILDSGVTDDGHAFIAMELLRGEDLGRRLAKFGKLTVNETALLVAQVSRGLSKAHAVDVVHRDLKPENIFVVDEDDGFIVKILDFGIAKSIDSRTATHKTDTGQLLATPTYMSPEQALGHKIDARSDLYSLAVVAYRCLAGRPPFIHSAVGELIVAVSTYTPPPPSHFNPDLSPEIDAWFVGALAKEPAARACQTPLELAESFYRACGGAVVGLLPPSGSLRTIARHSSPPTLRSSDSEPPLPSREEIATTVVDTDSPPGRPPTARRPSLARRWWPVLAGLIVAGTGTAAFRVRTQLGTPTVHAVLPALEAARPNQQETFTNSGAGSPPQVEERVVTQPKLDARATKFIARASVKPKNLAFSLVPAPLVPPPEPVLEVTLPSPAQPERGPAPEPPKDNPRPPVLIIDRTKPWP